MIPSAPDSSPAWRDPAEILPGLSGLSPEMSGKRLELLKEIAPKLARVAVLGTSTESGQALMLELHRTRCKASE